MRTDELFTVWRGGLDNVVNSNKPATAQTSSPGSDNKINNQLTSMLNSMNALPSDIEAISPRLRSILNDVNVVDDPTGIYLNLKKELIKLDYSKAKYKEAYDSVTKNNAFNEYAVTNDGKVICRNGDDFTLATPQELQNSKYRPLTYSEVLDLRANNSQSAGLDSLSSLAAGNGTMANVTSFVSELIKQMGANEVDVLNTEVQNTVKTKSSATQLPRMMQYILSTLPQQYKTLLMLHSDNTEEGANDLLANLIGGLVGGKEVSSGNTNSKSTSTGRGGNSDKSSIDKSSNRLTAFIEGYGGNKQQFKIQKSDGTFLSVDSSKYNIAYDKEDKPITDTSVADVLIRMGLAMDANLGDATFGDVPINFNQLQNIAYDNSGVTRVILPTKNGKVDLNLIDRFNKFQKEAVSEIPENRIKLAKKYELDDVILPNGTWNPDKVGLFAVMSGATTDELLGVDLDDEDENDEKFYKYIQRSETDDTMKLIEKSLSGVEVDTEQGVYNPKDWFGQYDKMYRAAVYVPLNGNLVNAFLPEGDLPTDYRNYQASYNSTFNKVNSSTSVLK